MNLFKKPFVYVACFGFILTGANAYALLKTFVIPEVKGYVAYAETVSETVKETNSEAKKDAVENVKEKTKTYSWKNVSKDDAVENDKGLANEDTSKSDSNAEDSSSTTENSYKDDNISINIETINKYNTTIYVADVKLTSSKYLKTALANNAFGTNVVQKTSGMAKNNNAILAINGDYYGANSRGYVIKNGVIYRDTKRRDSSYDDLAIYSDGHFEIINESEITAKELVDSGVVNLFAFGPVLIENSEIAISENTEVAKAMGSNPRTAIGIIEDNHYIFVVSDGRTYESEGLSLYELAEVLKSYNVKTAYNLDGGGSSTMYFNNEIVNNPTTNGHNISEREVSDIVYIGY